MKSRTLFCFMALLAFASCSDNDEEIEDVVFPSEQEQDSAHKSLTAIISDGLHANWSAGDIIMLLHDGQTVLVEAQESGCKSSQALSKALSLMRILCVAHIRQITWCLRIMKV